MKKVCLQIAGIFCVFMLCSAFSGRVFSADNPAAIAPQKAVSWLLDGKGPDFEKAASYIKENYPPEVIQLLQNFLISEDEDEDDKKTALAAFELYPVTRFKDYYITALEKTTTPSIKRDLILFTGRALDKSFVVPISKELENPFAEVRAAAISVLREIGDDRMFPVIFRMAENKDPVYRYYALESLNVMYDIRLFSIVHNLLADESKSVRILALQCIERNNLDKLLPEVRKTAQSDSNKEARIAAIQIIARMKDQGGAPVIIRMLSDPEKEIRLASALALLQLKPKQAGSAVSGQLAAETDNGIKDILLDIIIDSRSGGDFKGLEEMIVRETYLPLRIKSTYALSLIGGPRSQSLLLKALNDKEYKIRAEAAAGLSGYRDRQTVSALIDVINTDSERYVRLAALYSIERIRDRSSVIPLLDRYNVETDPVFRHKLYLATRMLLQ